ncbi:UDP-N-acetylglucosamine--LPS N-acetylglucosamine transferase [Xylophilus sp. Kf1]|nr:UDP-N-acetylglucosamine--LPS N-acetylglucosamine transferase [Xylophilus sp. Kf1]
MARILAVASKGGHWVQLMRMRPAFNGHEVTYLSTDDRYGEQVGHPVIAVTDGNRQQKWRAFWMLLQVARHVVRLRPQVIVTTGAAPGLAAIVVGRLVNARTVWIDSLANAEQLSLCGRLARHCSTTCVTQWDHLEDGEHIRYWGAVL